jgi:hypothetical protein
MKISMDTLSPLVRRTVRDHTAPKPPQKVRQKGFRLHNRNESDFLTTFKKSMKTFKTLPGSLLPVPDPGAIRSQRPLCKINRPSLSCGFHVCNKVPDVPASENLGTVKKLLASTKKSEGSTPCKKFHHHGFFSLFTKKQLSKSSEPPFSTTF